HRRERLSPVLSCVRQGPHPPWRMGALSYEGGSRSAETDGPGVGLAQLDVGDAIAGHEHDAALGVAQGEGSAADGGRDLGLDLLLASVDVDDDLTGGVLDTDLDLHVRSSFWCGCRG